MKRIFALLFIFLCMGATAQTINWYVDGSVYDTTTCQSGDNVTPPTPPAKYGHTFKWWVDPSIITGTVTQNGTPTPDNPIYPTFYQNGDLILRAINGNNNNLIADTYSSATGQIVRRIGVKVFDGTEEWARYGIVGDGYLYYTENTITDNKIGASGLDLYCSHAVPTDNPSYWAPGVCRFQLTSGGSTVGSSRFYFYSPASTSGNFKQWLVDQYAAGTPVTVIYPLATPVIENYTPSNP